MSSMLMDMSAALAAGEGDLKQPEATAADKLYEEYKEARLERRQKAELRRNANPEAYYDLPIIPADQFAASLDKQHETREPAPLPDLHRPIKPATYEAAPYAVPEHPGLRVQQSSGANQWTDKHVREDHDYWKMGQWTRHIRDVHRASPFQYEEQEAELRRVAAKTRERENARAPYPYSYRGVEQPSAQEPFHYPNHHGQVQRTVTAHQTAYDQRYGNSLATQSARSMPVTFIKHRNPRDHLGQAAGAGCFKTHRNAVGYEPAAQSAYGGVWQ